MAAPVTPAASSCRRPSACRPAGIAPSCWSCGMEQKLNEDGFGCGRDRGRPRVREGEAVDIRRGLGPELSSLACSTMLPSTRGVGSVDWE